jgi:beta-N-acetylhexosaminidase
MVSTVAVGGPATVAVVDSSGKGAGADSVDVDHDPARGVVVDTFSAPPRVPDRIASFLSGFPREALDLQQWDTTGATEWVAASLASMSLREKLGQLIIVRLVRGRDDKLPLARDTRAVERDAVGGFIVSRLLPPVMVAEEVSRLQSISRIPLFFSADYERGVGRFSNNFTELPSNMAIGATRDTVAATLAGILTAMESRAIGVNLLFAPVVDVNNNPANPIINIRSYGEDPELVASLSANYIRGAESYGVLTTAKHFPGHGNSSIDTHAHMDVVGGTLDDLRKMELLPYERLLSSDAAPSAIMMAHLGVEAFDKQRIPSTLSSAVTGYLRNLAGPDALIITDDVRMGALQNDYSLTDRVVGPIAAGADIILTPESVPPAIDALEAAIASGRLAESRIDESVRRILRSKAAIGLHRNAKPHAGLVAAFSRTPYGQPIADSIAVESVTYFKGGWSGLLPPTTTLVQLSNFDGSESIDRAMKEFAESLGVSVERELRQGATAQATATGATMNWLRGQEGDGPVVVALHLRLRSGRGSAGLTEDNENVLRTVFDLKRPTIVVLFGNPYVAVEMNQAQTIVITYDQTLSTVRAVANVLRGKAIPNGTLPVSVIGAPTK